MGCSPSVVTVKFESRGPYEEVRLLERERRNLDKYFNHLSAKLRNKHNQEETIHVRDAVEKSVRQILDSVAMVDGRFRLKEKNALLRVGSFYEGNQITDTYRVDFIIILDDFTPDVVAIEVENKRNGCLPVKVIVDEDEKAVKPFGNKWKSVLNGKTFLGSRNDVVKRDGLLDKFVKRLKYVATRFTQPPTQFGVLNVSNESATRIWKEGSFVVVQFVLTNTFERHNKLQSIEESSCRAIYVTLTPAIKLVGVCDYIYPQDFHFQRLYDAILKSGTFLVVPSSDGYFKMAFTETENSLLRQMSQKHKRALCVVKFLIKGDSSVFETRDVSKYALFDSKSIKMIMLALEETCPCNKGSSEYDLYECVIHVMKVVHASLHNHCAHFTDDWDTNDEKIHPDIDEIENRSYVWGAVESRTGSYVKNSDESSSEVDETVTHKSVLALGTSASVENHEGSLVRANIRNKSETERMNNETDDGLQRYADDDGDIANNTENGKYDTKVLENSVDDVSQEHKIQQHENDDVSAIESNKDSCSKISTDTSTTRKLPDVDQASKRRRGVALTLDQRWAETDDHPEQRSEPGSVNIPLEYDILRLLSPEMRLKVSETSLYVNCANFYELMKHDLKYWIGQREKYNLSQTVPNYGVTCLQEKIRKNTNN